MKRLKSSRFVKTVCFLLCLLFLTGAASNLLLGVFVTEEDILYADETQYAEMIYEAIIHRYNYGDIRRYLVNTVYGEDDLGSPQWQKNLPENKFNRENSNLSFTVTDEDGHTVLHNFDLADKSFTFTTAIRLSDNELYSDTVHLEGVTEPSYDIADSTAPTSSPVEETTQQPETTTPPEEAAPTEANAAREEPTQESTTYLPNPIPTTEPQTRLYIEDKTNGDEWQNPAPYRFRYYYTGDRYDDRILDYCRQCYTEDNDWYSPYAERSEGWLTFYEDDFAVSDNGIVYYREDIEPSTHLSSYAEEQETYTEYTAAYALPQTFTAKDIFYYANRIIGPSYWYLHHLAALTVAFAVASLLFFILTLMLAGHVRNESAPLARGLHRLPYDLVCAVVFTTAVSLLVLLLDDLPYSNPVPYIVAASALVLTLMLFIETTVVRCKAKTIGKNFLVVKLFSLLIRALKKLKTLLLKASANMNLLWKLGLLFGVTVVAGFIYSLLLTEEEEFIFLWVVVKILEIPLLLWMAACWNRLQKGARNLSEGHISEKVDANHLFGEFKKNADYLNAISDGVNKEVRERMKSESMKTELITNVSHDLKTPLTSIINYVDLLKGTDVTDPKAREYIDVIDRQSQRLKKLCADVVDASKAATGAMHVTKEPTTLNVMLTQAVGEYDERLKARRLQLMAEIPAEPISVNADGKLLWRVFDNLMNNICQYAMEGTRVYLTLSARDDAASVMFRNISGAALNITPEELTERFVRGDASRNTEGSGLGLSISKSLTELMGGAFTVAIDGDLFKVTLTFPLLM